MSFFISDALANAPAAPQEPNMLFTFGPLVLLFVVFYFFLIRPQNKRQKEHKAMVESLDAGTEIVTNGGLLGRVSKVGESFISVKIAEGTEVQIQRHAIAQVLPKGTIKDAKKA